MSPSTARPGKPAASRRTVLSGTALGAVGIPLLAACGSEEAPNAGAYGGGAAQPSDPPSQDAGQSPSEKTSQPATTGLVAAAEVPVGGGVILAEEKLVVTQPAKDDFRAFSAVCTHMGCVVSSVSDGQIRCGCHGSAFAIADGSVTGGPASRSLESRPVAVRDGQVRLR